MEIEINKQKYLQNYMNRCLQENEYLKRQLVALENIQTPSFSNFSQKIISPKPDTSSQISQNPNIVYKPQVSPIRVAVQTPQFINHSPQIHPIRTNFSYVQPQLQPNVSYVQPKIQPAFLYPQNITQQRQNPLFLQPFQPQIYKQPQQQQQQQLYSMPQIRQLSLSAQFNQPQNPIVLSSSSATPTTSPKPQQRQEPVVTPSKPKIDEPKLEQNEPNLADKNNDDEIDEETLKLLFANAPDELKEKYKHILQ